MLADPRSRGGMMPVRKHKYIKQRLVSDVDTASEVIVQINSTILKISGFWKNKSLEIQCMECKKPAVWIGVTETKFQLDKPLWKKQYRIFSITDTRGVQCFPFQPNQCLQRSLILMSLKNVFIVSLPPAADFKIKGYYSFPRDNSVTQPGFLIKWLRHSTVHEDCLQQAM